MVNNKQGAIASFSTRYIAHRGLHDNAADWPENTLAAFARAVEAGYGIELDVHVTRDDQLVVAHDDGLGRICGEDVAIADLSLGELRQRRVLGSTQTIPLLSEVLSVVDGRVPLIVEIKQESDATRIAKLTNAVMSTYDGVYCIESFDPRVLWWYRLHRPDVTRGQLADVVTPEVSTSFKVLDWALTNMAFNLITWPDFIAYDCQHAAQPALHWWRRVLGCPLVAWTIRSQRQLDNAKHSFSAYIFEGFTPAVD